MTLLVSQMSKKHNISGKESLSLLDATPLQLSYYRRRLTEVKLQSTRTESFVAGSLCMVPKAHDGRLTFEGKKVCYAYQLVAHDVFGRERMLQVESSKSGSSLTISHLCGTRFCINERHLILETKRINDERVHCHTVLHRVARARGYDAVRALVLQYPEICSHTPKCWEVSVS